MLDPPVFSTVLVYATFSRHYVVAGTRDKSRWRILNVSRVVNDDNSLDASEDPTTYDESQCARVLASISAGNAGVGGMRLVARGVAVVGTLRILDGHYLCFVTERELVGQIRGHHVFGVRATELLRIAESGKSGPTSSNSSSGNTNKHQSTSANPHAPASAAEKKLKRLLTTNDSSRGCFYSHTYGVCATLQSNALDSDAEALARVDFDSAFVWNSHLSRPLRVAIGETATARWVTPLVHGFFEMRRVSLLGTALDVVLLARRSRHFAGTRYRRRGVNASGRVANEVETEQILDVVVEAVDDRGGVRGDKKNTPPPRVASAVQMRGSIPVFWSQEASVLEARPEIVLGNGRADDPNHAATAKHLDLVERRYGAPIVMLSLVRSNERRRREEVLRDALHDALETINQVRAGAGRERVACVHWDFAKHMRRGARVQNASNSANGGLGETRAAARALETETDATPDATTPGVRDTEVRIGPFPNSSTVCPYNTDKFLVQSQPLESSTQIGLTRLARVAAGALELVGVFAVGPRVALEAAAARRPSRDARGGPTARAAAAWRDAGCERVTGFVSSDTSRDYASPWSVTFGSPPWVTSDDDVRTQIGVISQRGALRTHCVDCLDRTNVAQFVWGLAAMGAQLEALGISDDKALPMDGSLAGITLEMYRAMGDSLAMQYGGSEAHAELLKGNDASGAGSVADGGGWEFARRVRESAATTSNKVLTSVKRWHSNAYTDQDKQTGIDLWIGAHPATKAVGARVAETDTLFSEGRKKTEPRVDLSTLNWTLLRGAEFRDNHGGDDENGVDENGETSKLVSLATVTASRLKATPVRLENNSSRRGFAPPPGSTLERTQCARLISHVCDECSSLLVSEEDARLYAFFATRAEVDESFYFPEIGKGGAFSFSCTNRNEPPFDELDWKHEWSETDAAAEYAAIATAVETAARV